MYSFDVLSIAAAVCGAADLSAVLACTLWTLLAASTTGACLLHCTRSRRSLSVYRCVIPEWSRSVAYSFLKVVSQFRQKFQVEGDVHRQLFLRDEIGQWIPYNFVTQSVYRKKLRTRLYSSKVHL